MCAHTQVTHARVCTRVGSVSPAAPGSGCLWCQRALRAGWEGAAEVRGVSVPNGSFSSQENSDVFLSTVDTDWKVGPAMGGAAHPWVSHGTAASAWGRLWGTEWTQGCSVLSSMGMQCLVSFCARSCTSIMVLVRRGRGDAARHLCAGARMLLVGTWPWAGDKTFKTDNFFSGRPSCFSSPSTIAMAMVSQAMPAPCLHKDV